MKHIKIVNDDTRVVKMMLQVVASLIVILTTLQVSSMLLETIYSTGNTHDNHHDDSNIFVVQATVCHKTLKQKNGRSKSLGLDLSRPLLRDRMIHHIRLIF
jgi:hypothetical protein